MAETTSEMIPAIVAVSALGGAMIAACVQYFIARRQNKTVKAQMLNELGKPIHSKRIKAYLEIFALVSGFIKDSHVDYDSNDGKIVRAKFDTFYRDYFNLDSKWSLLFSEHTWHASSDLIKKLRKINEDDNLEVGDHVILPDIKKYLGAMEKAMKYEIGTVAFRHPAAQDYGKYEESFLHYDEKMAGREKEKDELITSRFRASG